MGVGAAAVLAIGLALNTGNTYHGMMAFGLAVVLMVLAGRNPAV